MESEFWNRFCETGRIEDYLSYKKSSSREGETVDEADNGRAGDMGDEDGGSGPSDNTAVR